MSREAIVYRLQVVDSNGRVIASRAVRTDWEGKPTPRSDDPAAFKLMELQWSIKAGELFRDVMHNEGRWFK